MNVSEEQRNGKNINARVHLHILFPKIKSVYKMLKGEIYSQGSQQSEQSVVHHVTSLFLPGGTGYQGKSLVGQLAVCSSLPGLGCYILRCLSRQVKKILLGERCADYASKCGNVGSFPNFYFDTAHSCSRQIIMTIKKLNLKFPRQLRCEACV